MRMLCGIALGALAPLLAAAADDTDLHLLLRTGRIAEAADRLQDEGEQARWVGSPDHLAALCETAAKNADAIAASGDHALRLGHSLDYMVSTVLSSSADSLDGLRARAYAGFVRAKAHSVAGKPGAADLWIGVARDFEAVAARTPDRPDFWCETAEALGRAWESGGADPRPGFEQAEAALAKLPKEIAETPEVASRVARARLDWARVAAKRKVPGVEDYVIRALAALKGPESKSPYDLHLGRARNEAAVLVRELKLGRPKVDFVSETHVVGEQVQMQLPLSTLWHAPSGGRQFAQVTPSGLRRRRFAFGAWGGNSEQSFGEGPLVQGTNIKGLADGFFGKACAALKEVRAKVPPKRATLKRCNPGWYFEVQGLDASGKFIRIREWFFKGTQGQDQTFAILLEEFREGETDDPELEFMLDSIREIPKK